MKLRLPSLRTALYSGDGEFLDRGVMSAAERFEIRFGEIRLHEVGKYCFSAARLPRVNFTLGLCISSDVPIGLAVRKREQFSTVVSCNVVNERGEVVVSQRAPLDEWTWSSSGMVSTESFVYLQGESKTTELGNGITMTESVGHTADRGWGTCLVPRFRGRYEIEISVEVADIRAASLRAELHLVGGGWK